MIKLFLGLIFIVGTAHAQLFSNPIKLFATDPSGSCAPRTIALSVATGNGFYCNPATNAWAVLAGSGGGTGTVTSVVIAGTANKITVSGTCTITISGTCTLTIPTGVVLVAPVLGTPASGDASNLTNIPACATCVVASSPVVGIAHFAGSTQTVTSSTIVNADIANSTIDLTTKVTGVLPTANIAVALANQTSLRGNAMAVAAGDATIGQVIAHGAKALDFASTATGACATVITDTATGTASTDTIIFNANASIKAVTGYIPASTGGFSIVAYPTTDTVNFEACNWTSGTVDPGSITVNWKVVR